MFFTNLAILVAVQLLSHDALGGSITPSPPKRRLVVLITVDQLRPDYFDRYRAQWTGGFKRLLDGGVFFTDGRQDHALTETAPGHSTLLSGRRPASTGIVSNDFGAEDASVHLLGASGRGASPRRFRGTTLYDWMRAVDSGARVLSVSSKDRGAIMPIGRARGDVYWYVGGNFTTSTWYRDTLPVWVQAFNARHGPQRLAGSTWNLLLGAENYPEVDSAPWENSHRDYTFPHQLPTGLDSIVSRLVYYPWMDSLTFDLALEGTAHLGLGRRDRPDLLAISLSTTDEVGHDYGPDSPEIHDHLLRLDRWLGWFLDSLAAMVPAEQTVFVLTSDHGVQSFPEYTAQVLGRPAGRNTLAHMAKDLRAHYMARYGTDFGFASDGGLLSADVAEMRRRGIRVDSLARVLAIEVRRWPGVTRVFTPASLAATPATDRGARLWKSNLPSDHGWLMAAEVGPGYMWQSSDGWTNHGTGVDLDVRVPIVFWGEGIRQGRYDRPVPTVDIGPTLAAIVGVRPTEVVEGRIIPEVFPPDHVQRSSFNVQR